MINRFKKAIGYIVDCFVVHVLGHILKYIPGVQEVCNEEVSRKPRSLTFIPDHFKTKEMCNEAVRIEPILLSCVPYHPKTQEMCNEAVRNSPCTLRLIPDRLKTQEMCNQAVRNNPTVFFFLSLIILRHRRRMTQQL